MVMMIIIMVKASSCFESVEVIVAAPLTHSPSPCRLNCNNSGIQCLPSFFISYQFGPDEFMSCAKVFILLVSISNGYSTNPATCFC